MKPIHCSECGNELTVILRSMKKPQRIVKLVQPHKCREFNKEFEFELTNLAPMEKDKKEVDLVKTSKVVQKLNELNKTVFDSISDTRDEAVDLRKSTVPSGILDKVESGG